MHNCICFQTELSESLLDDVTQVEFDATDTPLVSPRTSGTPSTSNAEATRPSSSQSSATTSHKSGNKGRQEKQLLQLASETLQKYNSKPAPSPQVPPVSDEFDIAGKKYASDLKGMSNSQRVIAEKLVSDIIFFGKMDQLTPYSLIQTNYTPPFQQNPSHNYDYPPAPDAPAYETRYENNLTPLNARKIQNVNEFSNMLRFDQNP